MMPRDMPALLERSRRHRRTLAAVTIACAVVFVVGASAIVSSLSAGSWSWSRVLMVVATLLAASGGVSAALTRHRLAVAIRAAEAADAVGSAQDE